ncbi:MAG TPA: hypothetical protein VN873_20230 [Candidatus Angelobacter sp.]|nr:hypothetical protein [Candidatus Angelobacter sp.]
MVLVLASSVALCIALAADQNPPPSTTVKGFQAPLEYFDPPHELQMKSFLEGSEAEPAADGLILIHDAKLKTFRVDGSTEMIVKAPHCIFDSRDHTVSSDGPLHVQTWDEKRLVDVQGVGFFWRETNSDLIISNQQRTTITGALTNTFSP